MVEHGLDEHSAQRPAIIPARAQRIEEVATAESGGAHAGRLENHRATAALWSRSANTLVAALRRQPSSRAAVLERFRPIATR